MSSPPTERSQEKARAIIATDQDVREAVAETGGAPEAPALRATPKDRAIIALTAVTAALAFGARAALGLPALEQVSTRFPVLGRLALGLALAAATLLGERIVEVTLIGRVKDAVARHDLKRVLRLLLGLAAAALLVTTAFANWKAAVTSLGLISLVMGFALQTPITSLIGWAYILVKRPYRVGDRIRMGDVAGDVIDVGYLDTTLWEFGGEYLSTDHPSGRLIKFPNSNVLESPVWNYSWPAFPFIWNEVKFHVGYDSDLDFVAKVMESAASEEIGDRMADNVKTYREILARTPVNHLDVNERPSVLFRVSDNTWLEVIVRYLVHPKEAGRVKTRVLRKALGRLRAEPERVRFPKGDAR